MKISVDDGSGNASQSADSRDRIRGAAEKIQGFRRISAGVVREWGTRPAEGRNDGGPRCTSADAPGCRKTLLQGENLIFGAESAASATAVALLKGIAGSACGGDRDRAAGIQGSDRQFG